MKIHELRLKNLNSLYGEWEIDFTNQDYQDSGIFLISGPTGAGKTTVLDAICLALYGKTPRLSSINQSGNEIMSRHTTDCYAEVVFQTNEGIYQARWSQRRAKGKVDGNLQAQKREISKWNPETEHFDLLESYTSRVDDVVLEKTGMNFGRFTRSIMLAQGQFAVFLQAKDDERSETLEQITGTEIYTRISRGVFERHKVEREKLEDLEKELEGIIQLSDAEFFEMDIEKSEKARLIGVCQKDLETIQEQQEWLRNIGSLKKNLLENQVALANHKKDLEAFVPQRKILEDAEKASALRAPYETLKSYRTQIAQDNEKLREATDHLKKAEQEKSEKAKVLSEAIQKKDTREKAAATTREIFKKVRDLDTQIKAAREICEETIRKEEAAKKEAKSAENEFTEGKKQREKDHQELETHRRYLEENKSDEPLLRELSALREQAAQWEKARVTAEKRQSGLPQFQKRRSEIQAAEERKKTELKSGETTLLDLKNQIERHDKSRLALLGDRLLRELKKEAETLEERLWLEEKIINLEAERSRLSVGEHCPLCGSTEHPFANREALPEVSATRQNLALIKKQLNKYEELSDQIQTQQQAASEKAVALEKTKGEASLLTQELESLSKEIANLQAEIAIAKQEVESCRSAIEQTLKPFGIDVKEELDSVFSELKKRETAWKLHESAAARLVEASRETGEQLASVTARLKTLLENHEKIQQEAKIQQANLKTLQSNRQKLFGEKDPETEEQSLNTEIQALVAEEKQALTSLTETSQTVTEGQTLIKDLSARLKDIEPKLKESTASFEKRLKEQGFGDESAFLAKSLEPRGLEVLKQQAIALDSRASELNALGEDLKSKIEREEKKSLTSKNLEALEKLKEPLLERMGELSERIGQLTVKLELEQLARNKKKDHLAEYSEQQVKYSPWKQLNLLIGSADGKRYRNFAQGLTFEVMIGHANRQLARITDRYLLIRDNDPAKALSLNVVDHYQGGEIRPTTNLSGGETFIVSLALALGLSQMASEKVRVDSLFLDEGFGTLDEETLEEALDALATLKKEEKLIGVISHVPALKERLSVQLKIDQQSRGRSLLSGPGVTKREEGDGEGASAEVEESELLFQSQQ